MHAVRCSAQAESRRCSLLHYFLSRKLGILRPGTIKFYLRPRAGLPGAAFLHWEMMVGTVSSDPDCSCDSFLLEHSSYSKFLNFQRSPKTGFRIFLNPLTYNVRFGCTWKRKSTRFPCLCCSLGSPCTYIVQKSPRGCITNQNPLSGINRDATLTFLDIGCPCFHGCHSSVIFCGTSDLKFW